MCACTASVLDIDTTLRAVALPVERVDGCHTWGAWVRLLVVGLFVLPLAQVERVTLLLAIWTRDIVGWALLPCMAFLFADAASHVLDDCLAVAVARSMAAPAALDAGLLVEAIRTLRCLVTSPTPRALFVVRPLLCT